MESFVSSSRIHSSRRAVSKIFLVPHIHPILFIQDIKETKASRIKASRTFWCLSLLSFGIVTCLAFKCLQLNSSHNVMPNCQYSNAKDVQNKKLKMKHIVISHISYPLN
ncbi:hypothetical protein AAHE18_02G169500 [Arachis hypogaea]